jgi:response regulator of citrate/malate metabolism
MWFMERSRQMTTQTKEILTLKQRRALKFLMTTPSTAEAARQSDVSERTLRRYLADPAFAGALNQAESAVVETTTRRLTGMTQSALDAVQAILSDSTASPTARLRAAEITLNQMARQREVRDLERRLTALESLWATQHDGSTHV